MEPLLLAAGVAAAVLVVNAFAPRRRRGLRFASVLAAGPTIELAPHLLAAVVALAVAGVATGPGGPAGVVGLLLLLAAAGGLAVLIQESRRTGGIMRGALAGLERFPDLVPAGGTVPRGPRYARSAVAFPAALGRRRGVQTLRNLTYARAGGRTLRLDLTLPGRARPGDLRPVILQIHGGAWTIGDKRSQGLPLLNHLAAQGWIGVNANYRLSPAATFPDHLVDCKRAVAWIRSHIADYGGDPDNVSVTGGSAGAHLAALVALTADRGTYQPGFEGIDTSVRAAVLLYGAYDLTDRLGTWPPDLFHRVVETWLVKGFLDEEPDLFRAASPLDQIGEGAPPVLIVHGTRDTVTAVEDARLFARQLGETSRNPALYAELPGAQHAFDLLPSVRSAQVIEGVERFLTTCARR